MCNLKQTKLLCQYVLSLAKYDQNYDIRDRARFLRALVIPPEVCNRKQIGGSDSVVPHSSTRPHSSASFCSETVTSVVCDTCNHFTVHRVRRPLFQSTPKRYFLLQNLLQCLNLHSKVSIIQHLLNTPFSLLSHLSPSHLAPPPSPRSPSTQTVFTGSWALSRTQSTARWLATPPSLTSPPRLLIPAYVRWRTTRGGVRKPRRGRRRTFTSQVGPLDHTPFCV